MQMLNAHPRADCHQVGMNGQCSAIVILMNLLHTGCLASLTRGVDRGAGRGLAPVPKFVLNI